MNSKTFLSLSAVVSSMVAFADPNAPQVTACTVTQDSVTHLVKATYTLDEPAVVTFDVKTNGVSIGGANLTHAYGDVHRVIEAGEHTLYWQADKAWQGHRLSSASFEVVAWATNAPPDYMVVDLVVKKGARTYYIAPEQLPDGGVTNRKYKTDYLVMRRIPAAGKTFRMGSPAEEPGRTNIEFDSYSIVNQQKASWKWAFDPQPLFVSNPEVRNPVVTVADGQSYDVTLTVATPAGTDTKTVRRMIAGDKDVPNGITGEELLPSDILLSSSHISKGQTLTLTPRNIHAPCQWKLFDTSGRIVQTLTVEAQGQTTIATDGLATGVHYYLLTGNGFKKAGKMTVSN